MVEAEGLEAKDVNGFSDPYCMLGIKPGAGHSSLATPVIRRKSARSPDGSMERASSINSDSNSEADAGDHVASSLPEFRQDKVIHRKTTSFRDRFLLI